MSYVAVVALFCIAGLVQANLHESTVTEEFDVKPGSESHTVTATLPGDEKVSCSFLYQAMGGTNEQWAITLNEEKDGTHTCEITRPGKKSYLFFQHFVIKFAPSKVMKVLEAKNADGKELDETEYFVGTESVKYGPKFKNSLSKIKISARA